jgi:hypothetical protein
MSVIGIGLSNPAKSRELVGIGRKFGRLYGLPERGQTDISSLLKVQCESLILPFFPC